ncbi:MAG: shikimate kinase [Luminiphilus sp.]|nr:shikimate kinase [Luminiphilus sp.]
MTASNGLYQIFRWVKYLTYALLSLNIWLFFSEELNSARFAIETGEEVALGVQLFSATLDTLAWVILLLLFELETAVIPDERLRGTIRFGIHGVRMVCTAAIMMAFLGYSGEWLTLLPSEPLSGEACSRVTESWSVMTKLDDFMPLTAENCGQFGADTRIVTGLDQVMASPAGLLEGQRLALVDVINSAAWILVVILLEIEVRVLTRWGGASRPLSRVATFAKAVLYATLVAAAIYWGFKGDFLDFWDAALWLFAFVFIELNVFEWQQELRYQTSEAPGID